MKRIICILLCVLMTLSVCMLCACNSTEKELRKISLNEVTRSVFYAPLYVAISNGYMEEEGLEIEIVTGGGSDKSMTALLSGDADIALMGPETGIYERF